MEECNESTAINDYDVILRKEIMREAFAGLKADFRRFMMEHRISDEDKSEPLALLFWEINDIYLDIIGPRYKTVNDMIEVQGQFKFFKNYIEKLGNINGQH